MAIIKVEISGTGDVLIPSRAANLLMDGGNGNAALLYIYILSHSRDVDVAAAAGRLSLSEDDVLRALDSLVASGLVGIGDKPAVPERSVAAPEYSASDVAEHIGSDREFKQLADFCENSLGKILTTLDLQVLLSIYSWLGLPADVICILITSCIEEYRRKYGAARVPTMRTIEKTAKIWAQNGVFTCKRAEEYLAECARQKSEKRRIAGLLRLGDRALSPTEEKYISSWISLSIPDELISAAYDKTVVNTGSLKWRYMDKILESWHKLGFKSVSDVKSRGIIPSPRGESSDDEDIRASERLREINRRKNISTEEVLADELR